MRLNRILLPCFQGTVCTIGTATAVSPLLPPSAFATGTLTLTGSLSGTSLYTPISGVSLTLSFPAPYPFQFVGPVSLSERVISYNTMPDIPLSSLTFDFTGTSQGSAFTTPCRRSTIAASLTPQDGAAAVKLTAPVTLNGCPKRPTASGSLSGIAKHKPRLRLRAGAGTDPADISSLTITLPTGLRFQSRAIGHGCGSGAACKVKGLRLAGARLASASAHGASLRLTFSKPAVTAVIDATGPLLRESATLTRRKHAGSVRVAMRDTQGAATAVRLR
jgi:hypothetical protein